MILDLTITNPKRRGLESFESTWYRYYPGFSEGFAQSVLSSAGLGSRQLVLDPWNGSGTTTSKAVSLGLNACGFDLNPVMVLVAKARCLDPAEHPTLKPLATELCHKARKAFDLRPDDPLSVWMVPRAVAAIRGIEAAIQKLLVDARYYSTLKQRGLDDISDLTAFFYIALFRTLRRILGQFLTSNPTWVKRPASLRARVRPDSETVRDTFRTEVNKMLPVSPVKSNVIPRTKRMLSVASSESLPLHEASVDFVLSSPPYCTRIDYAVATSVELALLGYSLHFGFEELRRKLIGNTTVPAVAPILADDLGQTCLSFLETLSKHSSKASSTYYYKNHVQYFQSIASSLSEISRVLKPGGQCVLVVQDSYYKDLHNNLPQMFIEMAERRELRLEAKRDFGLSRTMAGINPGAKGYRNSFSAVETVLVIGKPRA